MVYKKKKKKNHQINYGFYEYDTGREGCILEAIF